jgi:hypothetical protein
MDLQAQVQALIEDAPEDEITQEGIQVVAIALAEIAQGLAHTEYYILQSFEGQWQVTTLQHRTQEDLQKTVLYAYGSLTDATKVGQSGELIAAPVPIVQLLFQFFSFDTVDSFLFIDDAQQPDQIRELRRQDLQALVQTYLKEHIANEPHGSAAIDLDTIA